MKHPLAHINFAAPFHLLRSLKFHLSSRTIKHSVSKKYLGLCAYVNASTNLSFEKNATIEFSDEGFLVLGTERSSFRGWAGRNSLFLKQNGKLRVEGYNEIGRGSLVWILDGGEVTLSGNTYTAGKNMIISKSKVQIGKNCCIAWGVTICDHDFHKLYLNGQQQVETAPIVIEEGVWIGMNATILKGVTIGKGSVVGAGSMVTNDVPPGTLVAGNPARVIKEKIEFYG